MWLVEPRKTIAVLRMVFVSIRQQQSVTIVSGGIPLDTSQFLPTPGVIVQKRSLDGRENESANTVFPFLCCDKIKIMIHYCCTVPVCVFSSHAVFLLLPLYCVSVSFWALSCAW